MNKGSIYDRSNVKTIPPEVTKGVELEFAEAYKKFWEKRGVNIQSHKDELPQENWKLSDPIQGDPVRLRKAIEYGRSYRKDKKP